MLNKGDYVILIDIFATIFLWTKSTKYLLSIDYVPGTILGIKKHKAY